MRRVRRIVGLLSGLVICSCALTGLDSKAREEFDVSVKGYNRMLRWHEMEMAGTAYTPEALRDSFLKAVEQLKQRGVTITDFRIVSHELKPDSLTGQVVAEFDYYILPSNRIKTVTYRQNWQYASGTGWRVSSPLPSFE